MAVTSELILKDMPSSQGEESGAVVVEQQKMSSDMQHYIDVLVETSPFTKDSVMDSRNVILELSKFWPKLQEWKEQASELWREIENAVRAIPTAETNPQILLRIAVASKGLLPIALPEPHESAVVATFDVIEGVLRRYILPVSEEAQVYNEMGIASGIMMMCQPLMPLINPVSDNTKLGLGAGNLYAERTRDRMLTADQDAEEEEEAKAISITSASPAPETHKNHQEASAEQHPAQSTHAGDIAETAGVGTIAEVERTREEGHRETRENVNHGGELNEPVGAQTESHGFLSQENTENAETAILAEAIGAAESEIMLTERNLADETTSVADNDTALIEGGQSEIEAVEGIEAGLVNTELPPEAETGLSTEAEPGVSPEAESRISTETESPFLPPREAVEAAVETREELLAESEAISAGEEINNAEGANTGIESSQTVSEGISEVARQGEEIAENINETAGSPNEEIPGSAEQETVIESDEMESEEVRSVVEINDETQESIREAGEEGRRYQILERSNESQNGSQTDNRSSVEEIKDVTDKIKEQFGEVDHHHEGQSLPYDALYQSSSPASRSINPDVGRAIASNYQARAAGIERPFHQTISISAHEKTGDAGPSSEMPVVRKFVAKGARIAAKAKVNSKSQPSDRTGGAVMAGGRRKPGVGMRADDQLQTRATRKTTKTAPIKKQVRKKEVAKGPMRPGSLKPPALEK